MQASLRIARSVAIRIVGDAVTARPVNEMAVRAVPHAERRIVVYPKLVVFHVIAGLASGPLRNIDVNQRRQFGENRKNCEIDCGESQRR